MEMVPTTDEPRSDLLADPALRTALERFVRGRVPEADVEDVVQATLTDALASKKQPGESEEIRRWVHGIAKNKIADVFRKRGREPIPESDPGREVAAESAPISAKDLLQWADQELPEGEQAERTLEWMLREGDGEKLETIAREENVPAPRLRQRVSRMRKHFRSRWAAQSAALVAVLVVFGGLLWFASRGATPDTPIVREPPEQPSPEDRARELRRFALEDCASERWQKCLDGLDEAKRLDPVGDEASAIGDARRAARRGLAPEPLDLGPESKQPDELKEQKSVPPKRAVPKKAGPKKKAAPAPNRIQQQRKEVPYDPKGGLDPGFEPPQQRALPPEAK